MKANRLNALLALAVVALVVLALSQHRTIRDLRSQLADRAATPTIAGAAAPAAGLPRVVAAPTEPVAAPPSAVLPETASATERPAVAEASDRAGTPSQRVMRDIAKMFDNPQMNEVMKASQRATLEVLYKNLLDAYQLTPEERVHFMDLLMARQMFRVETSMKMMGGNNDAAEMKALADEMREYDQVVKKEIETFLNNPDDSAEFAFYEKTMQERMALSGLNAELGKVQAPLADGVERQLIDIMARQKAAHTFRSDLADETNYDMDAARFSPENIAAFEQDLREVNAAIATEARTILTSDQLTAFTRTLEQMRQMQISQLKVAANMFAATPKPKG